MSAARGRFITLEGIDGAGKSTHAGWLADAIAARGHRVVATREPGGTPLGEKLRDLLLHVPMTHDTVAKSTTATRSTFQALHVLRISGGAATIVTNEAILQWQRKLAEEEGLYVEPASAGAIVAVAQLKAAGNIKASMQSILKGR